jgi:uncharacterized protein
VDFLLTDVETRVLGALIEKDITTPDYYPLSLNALVNACNQKSNRDPLMSLDEDAVRQALRSLNDKGLAGPANTSDSRVAKYEHRLQEAFNFDRRETALLCTLLLRGPQTPGELRGRSERLHRFDDLGEVQSALQRLMRPELALVKMVPRQAGNKEARYAHLLAGDVETEEPAAAEAMVVPSESTGERLAHLENEVVSLRQQVAGLQQQLADFRKQFE